MATIKQIDANRRNALKSTGPKTPEGKAKVSMNSLRHGLRARTVVLPGESREEFEQLCNDLEREWTPLSRTAQFYLEQMAVSQWKLTRMEVAEASIYRETTSAKIQLPLLDRLWQAQCRLERSYARAQRELERLQETRPPWDEREKQELELEQEQAASQPEAEVPSTQASPASMPQPVRRAPDFMPTASPAAPHSAERPDVDSAHRAAS